MAEAEPGAREGAGPLPDDARAVLAAARDAAAAHVNALHALRRLFAAEVGLAKAALVQALAFLLLATVMVATAYGLLTALLVAGLRSFGAPWPLAIAIALVLSIALAAVAAWRAKALLRHADFEGTRRQIKLGLRGLADEPGEDAAP
ncbi:hypothetical protein [Arenimonas sp.]|uniref:hypothetical protein n=1 Tax=Arenimonas sp. TaxID=1872635 RepID=UPI0025EA9635|nr:hypothetical protein [Arenimonas sp.]